MMWLSTLVCTASQEDTHWENVTDLLIIVGWNIPYNHWCQIDSLFPLVWMSHHQTMGGNNNNNNNSKSILYSSVWRSIC